MQRVTLAAAVGPEQLAQALDADPAIRLLDVRTTSEFGGTRIEGSYNVPLHELSAHAPAISRVRAPVVLVCRSGARARTAEYVLRREGMSNVHVLEGGLVAWRRHGLPVRRDPRPPGDLLRRLMGVAGILLAAFYVRQNAVLAVILGFMGFRMVSGQSAMPCAVAGTCTVPGSDTSSTVRALVDGPAPPPSRRDSAEGTAWKHK